MRDIIVYHGSRGGLRGAIQPISRTRCDFGRGFYMGDSEQQVKGLISEADTPTLYKLKLKLSEIPDDRILFLDGTDWVHTVLANRQKIAEFNRLDIAKEALRNSERYDILIGPIADDRMNEAMNRFSEYALTDKGLLACLKSVNYGNQYVAKTEFACSKIEVIEKKILRGKELDEVRQYTQQKRKDSRDIVVLMAQKFQRDGRYLNEIIQQEIEREEEIER